MSDVVKMDDAKAARRMGLPLTTEFKEGGEVKIRGEAHKLLTSGLNAGMKFRDRAFALADDPTQRRLTAASKAFAKIIPEFEKAVAMWDAALPAWRSIEDKMSDAAKEQAAFMIASQVVTVRLGHAINQWGPIFEALDDGEPVDVNTEGLWPFTPGPWQEAS